MPPNRELLPPSSFRPGTFFTEEPSQSLIPYLKKDSPRIRDISTPLTITERNIRGLKAKDDSVYLAIDMLRSIRIIRIVDWEGIDAILEIGSLKGWADLLPKVERLDIDASALTWEKYHNGEPEYGHLPILNPLYFKRLLCDDFEEFALYIDGSPTPIRHPGISALSMFGNRLRHLLFYDLTPSLLTFVVPSKYTLNLEDNGPLHCVWESPLYWPECRWIKVVIDFHWPEKFRDALFALQKKIADCIMVRLEQLSEPKCIVGIGGRRFVDVAGQCAKMQWNIVGAKRVKGLVKELINRKKVEARPTMDKTLEECFEIIELREAHLKEYGL